MEKGINFTSGDLGNNSVLNEVLMKANAQIDFSDLTYVNQAHQLALKTKLKACLGIDDAKEVLLTNSGTESLYLALLSLAKRGRGAIENPAYFGINRQVKQLGIDHQLWSNVSEIGTQRLGFVYGNTNINSVTGQSLSAGEKDKLVLALEVSGATMIEDNPCDLLSFSGEIPSRIVDRVNDTLYVGSFSKILMPQSLGFAIGKPETIHQMRSLKTTISLGISDHTVQLVLGSLQQEYIPRLQASLQSKWQHFKNLLETYPVGDFQEVDGGVFVRIDLPDSTDIDEFVEESQRCGVKIEANKYYYFDKKNRPFIRLNFAKNSGEVAEEGLKILAEVRNRLSLIAPGTNL